jgi:hypothetical protein
MALYYELPVYRDVCKLILMIFECSKDFSKEYKYTLGQDMYEKGSIFRQTFKYPLREENTPLVLPVLLPLP